MNFDEYLAPGRILNSDEMLAAFRFKMDCRQQSPVQPLTVVQIPCELMGTALDFSRRVATVKRQETQNQNDLGSMEKRWLTGFMADMATRIAWGFTDIPPHLLEISSFSSEHEFPDFADLGLRLGCKGSMFGTFPMVKPYEPKKQVIVSLAEGYKVAFILGIGNIRLFCKHSSVNFIKSESARNRSPAGEVPWKVGFYGIDLLDPFPSTIGDARERYARPH